MAQLLAILVERIPANELCLEVGIGTGRIAMPLVDAGVRVVGVDISTEMLRRLIAKRNTSWPQIAVADATRLPFANSAFGSCIASHVLHLIPAWQGAVAEVRRVVRPGGLLFASRGSRVVGGWRDEVGRYFFHEAGDPTWPPGMDDIEELDAVMTALGAQIEPFPDLLTDEASSIEDLIGTMENGFWAACWSLDDATRRRAAASTRQWARARFGDLSAERVARSGSVWRAYRLPE